MAWKEVKHRKQRVPRPRQHKATIELIPCDIGRRRRSCWIVASFLAHCRWQAWFDGKTENLRMMIFITTPCQSQIAKIQSTALANDKIPTWKVRSRFRFRFMCSLLSHCSGWSLDACLMLCRFLTQVHLEWAPYQGAIFEVYVESWVMT